MELSEFIVRSVVIAALVLAVPVIKVLLALAEWLSAKADQAYGEHQFSVASATAVLVQHKVLTPEAARKSITIVGADGDGGGA